MLCKEIMKFLSENNSENMIFIFTVCKKELFMNAWLLAKNLAQKVENIVYLSEISAMTLTFHD